MQIQLKQSEIKAAIFDYLTSQGIDMAVKQVNITFTAGRKGSGISAEVDIQDDQMAVVDSDADVEEEKQVAVAPPANLFN
jgi:hypothetical protein